jgi:hypothetical protein
MHDGPGGFCLWSGSSNVLAKAHVNGRKWPDSDRYRIAVPRYLCSTFDLFHHLKCVIDLDAKEPLLSSLV